jgi:hypothetical protein
MHVLVQPCDTEMMKVSIPILQNNTFLVSTRLIKTNYIHILTCENIISFAWHSKFELKEKSLPWVSHVKRIQ